MQHHPLATFRAGTTWVIDGQLRRRDKTNPPLDGSRTIKWTLVDATGAEVATEVDAVITVTDVLASTFRIKVLKERTETIPAGSYTDYLDLIEPDGSRIPYWQGPIIVEREI